MSGHCVVVRKNVAILRNLFPLQSFFDNTQLQNALLVQDTIAPMVEEVDDVNVSGQTIGLHPSSQCPVAVRLKGSNSGQAVMVLTPGQIVHGAMPDGFTSLDWGLPFGWLGGGIAKLVVADSDNAFIGWSQAKTEVLLQRLRMQIIADAAPTTSPALSATNWPNRFPWKNAYRYNTTAPSSPIQQGGQAEIAAEITRVVMRLRLNNLAAPTNMRLLLQGLNDFDIGSDGLTATYTDLNGIDVQWPVVATATSTPYPIVELTSVPALLRGDGAVATLTDAGNAALTSAYVDVCVYGKI